VQTCLWKIQPLAKKVDERVARMRTNINL